ncbi:MAG: dihydrolipoamide acetyltransferase family protein [Salinivirgaceae bacterium]|nr:dihydrolipoamide acetyltransferase family protein [Salinivirgaceae bacterium]
MTKKVKIVLPALGEGIIEATLMQWLKKVGDTINLDEPIAEIATDKVDTEVLSPAEGVVERFFFTEGEIPKVGDLIAVMSVADHVDIPAHLLLTDDSGNAKPSKKNIAGDKMPMLESEKESQHTIPAPSGRQAWISPLVKSIMKNEGISADELVNIVGTGQDSRVTRDDILAYLDKRITSPTSVSTPAPTQKAEPTTSYSTDSALHTIIPMSRLRTIIADRMVQSVQTAPHVTSFVEADVTNMVLWRNKNKAAFEKQHGQKLTFTPLFMEAVASAIKQFPNVNASVGKNEVIVHHEVNIGMATALPSGDLIVPVIKNAEEKNLLGLTKTVNDLATRARANKLKPDEIKGGTFTVTNVGSFNNISGTPIINQPEVAILALGAIKKRPAVIETPQGDTIGIRHQIILSLSYDHRVVDGSLGGMFLAKIGEILENFDINRTL